MTNEMKTKLISFITENSANMPEDLLDQMIEGIITGEAKVEFSSDEFQEEIEESTVITH